MIQKLETIIVEAQAYAKLIASLVGGLLVIGAQFIPEEWATGVTAIIVAMTAFSVYQLPNIPTVAVPPADEQVVQGE